MTTPKAPIDAMLDALDWTPVDPAAEPGPDGIPTVTHQGVLNVMGFAFRVYRLSDGQRIIPVEDMERFFLGVEGEGGGA